MRPSLKALLAVPLVLLSLTSGCGKSSQSSGETITYWANPMTADPALHQKTMETLLAKFTAQTGVHVKLEMQDWTKVYPKIIAGLSSGTAPDVFDTGATWAAALQATGGLMPFDTKAFDALGGRARFVPASMSSTGAPGPTAAVVPLYGQAYGLIYNPKMLAAAGIKTPPATWADFVADAKKLTKRGQWGVAVGGAAPLFQVHQAFIMGRQDGSRLFSASGKPTFDTPAERDAVRRLLDLMAVDKVVDPAMIEKTGVDAVTALAQGKAAMVITQSSSLGLLASLGAKDYAVAPTPTLSPLPAGGVADESMVAGTNLAVSADSDHKAADLELVKFLTSTEAQTTLNKTFGTLPVLTALSGQAPFDSPALQTYGQILANHAEPMPLVPAEGAMEAVLGPEIVKLWPKAADGTLTDADIDKALRTAEQLMPKS